MATVATASRSTSTFLRQMWRSKSSSTTATKRLSISLPTSSSSSSCCSSSCSIRSNITLRATRVAPPSPSRLLRRELSTFQPLHSTIASACLVSKLPSEACTSIEARFANYLSPI